VLAAIVVFRIVVDSIDDGEDPTWLGGAGPAALVCAAGAAVAGLMAILRDRDRSWLVVLAVVVGTLAIAFEFIELVI
jgi:hypothetical protein